MPNAIEFSGVSKTYSGGKHALDNINLCVPEGQFFGLLGPNGAGKTTLIGIPTTLIRKDCGTIRVFDHDFDTDPNKAKKMMSVVPQELNFNVFSTPMQTILAQAGYYGIPKKQAMPLAEKLLRKLQLWHKRNQQLRQLSGGMKRRLLIARALINKPKLLFLDEPTAGVDIELRSNIWKFLKEINQQGTTIILTTHYLEEAEELCNQIAIINQGRIIETTYTQAMLRNRDQETFILDLANMPEQLPQNLKVKLTRINNQSCHLTLNAQQSLNDAFAELNQHKLQVMSMRNETNRLEQYIMNLLKGEPL